MYHRRSQMSQMTHNQTICDIYDDKSDKYAPDFLMQSHIFVPKAGKNK